MSTVRPLRRTPEEEASYADRISEMQAGARRRWARFNWPLALAGVSLLAIAAASIVALRAGGDPSEGASPLRPQEAITAVEEPTRGTGEMFGGLDEEPVRSRSTELRQLRDELVTIRTELAEARKAPPVEAGSDPVLAKQVEALQATIGEMREQLGDARDYITALEQRLDGDRRQTPIRPLSLEDEKWSRALVLSEEDERDAARTAAPSMVFDASRRSRRQRAERDQRELLEGLGRTFPERQDVTLEPTTTDDNWEGFAPFAPQDGPR